MIRRDDGDHWLLISQVDHAHLAGDVASVWGNERMPRPPMPQLLVPAVRDHDEGWREWEQTPEVDPATGRPRDFTEMPMSAATAIWSRSIEACAGTEAVIEDVLDRFREFLDVQGKRLTKERIRVVQEMSAGPGLFTPEELAVRLGRSHPRVSRTTVSRTLTQLEQAKLLRSIAVPKPRGDSLPVYAVLPTLSPGSPLGGLCVSQHFTWLAEKARESRTDDPQEIEAVEAFLERQRGRQESWRNAYAAEAPDVDLGPLVELGFRFVQFFDRLSLWLCCARRSEPFCVDVPNDGPIELTPHDSGEIAIDPFPLSVERLELSVPALRIPARNYADDADLQTALDAASRESLSWALRAG